MDSLSWRFGRILYSLKKIIADYVCSLDVPKHIIGFNCICTAVETLLENSEMINCTAKELYQSISKYHQLTLSRVERAIRHSIEVACISEPKITNEMFGTTGKNKPDNLEFLRKIADTIKQM